MSECNTRKDDERDEKEDEEDKLPFHPGTDPENQSEISMLMGE